MKQGFDRGDPWEGLQSKLLRAKKKLVAVLASLESEKLEAFRAGESAMRERAAMDTRFGLQTREDIRALPLSDEVPPCR